MPLTKQDRELLQRCLAHKRGAWNDFVDRFLGLFYHVVRHTAYLRSTTLSPEDTEDLVADVLVHIISGDYALLRHFRGKSSLATYLTVIARRICVHALAGRNAANDVQPKQRIEEKELVDPAKPRNLGDVEEVEKLLQQLSKRERKVVRLHLLEGRTYEEISIATGIPINTIGPILSRAKKRLRNFNKDANGAPPKEKPKKPKKPKSADKLDKVVKEKKSSATIRTKKSDKLEKSEKTDKTDKKHKVNDEQSKKSDKKDNVDNENSKLPTNQEPAQVTEEDSSQG